MTKSQGRPPYPGDERLKKVLGRVASHLRVKKTKLLLESEIRETIGEIEHVKDRLAAALRQLEEKKSAIKALEFRMVEPTRKLKYLQIEKWAEEKEVVDLENAQREMEEKKKALSKLKAEAARLRIDNKVLSDRLKEVETRREDMQARKEELEKAMESLRGKIGVLEREIPVIENTKNFLDGIIPKGFDAVVFQNIKGGWEAKIARYVEEAHRKTEKIEAQINKLNVERKEKASQEVELLSQKGHLTKKIEEIKPRIGDGERRETLRAEFNELKEQRDVFLKETSEKTEEVRQLESAVKELDNALGQAKKSGNDSKERHALLVSRKMEMDRLGNVGDEIERLKEKTGKLQIDTQVDQVLLQIGNTIIEDLSRMNSRLQSAFEDYEELLVEFEHGVVASL